MTTLESMLNNLVQKKLQMQKIREQMSEIENNLSGLEIAVGNEKGMIEYVDGNRMNTRIYLEDEAGNSRDMTISFGELLKMVNI